MVTPRWRLVLHAAAAPSPVVGSSPCCASRCGASCQHQHTCRRVRDASEEHPYDVDKRHIASSATEGRGHAAGGRGKRRRRGEKRMEWIQQADGDPQVSRRTTRHRLLGAGGQDQHDQHAAGIGVRFFTAGWLGRGSAPRCNNAQVLLPDPLAVAQEVPPQVRAERSSQACCGDGWACYRGGGGRAGNNAAQRGDSGGGNLLFRKLLSTVTWAPRRRRRRAAQGLLRRRSMRFAPLGSP